MSIENAPEWMDAKAKALYAELENEYPALTEGRLMEMVWARLNPMNEGDSDE